MCHQSGEHNAASRKTDIILSKCLKQKQIITYLAKTELISFKGETNLQFGLRFDSTQRHVREETLIIDEFQLVAGLGGLLGLFIGFSIFGYVSTAFEAMLDKLGTKFSGTVNV